MRFKAAVDSRLLYRSTEICLFANYFESSKLVCPFSRKTDDLLHFLSLMIIIEETLGFGLSLEAIWRCHFELWETVPSLFTILWHFFTFIVLFKGFVGGGILFFHFGASESVDWIENTGLSKCKLCVIARQPIVIHCVSAAILVRVVLSV